jgi:diguanylate cyclase (GGDEF)-like protein
MSEVSQVRSRRPARSALASGAFGVVLVSVALALIVMGPSIMSRWAFTAAQLFAVALGLIYGLYLVLHSRNSQISIERAYSAHLEELSQRLRNMAYRDAVTGLYNHRYFREQLTHEVDRCTRYGETLALILLDMNNFKEINDRYGHFMGDRFLGLVGEVIARQVRSSDVGARYGGDEFVVILPSTSAEEARATAEKLALAVANCAAMTATGENVQLGISFGIAACPDDARAPSELIERADERLYAAKALRNPHGRAHVA